MKEIIESIKTGLTREGNEVTVHPMDVTEGVEITATSLNSKDFNQLIVLRERFKLEGVNVHAENGTIIIQLYKTDNNN